MATMRMPQLTVKQSSPSPNGSIVQPPHSGQLAGTVSTHSDLLSGGTISVRIIAGNYFPVFY